jgi:Tfp pilus assembly protein FimV
MMKHFFLWTVLWWSGVCWGAETMTLDAAVSRLLKDYAGATPSATVPQMVGQMPNDPRKANEAYKNVSETQTTYRVKRGETLDQVIRKLAPESNLQKNLLRQAFVKANPHAFRRNNPNWMYAGVLLKVPEIDDLRRLMFKDSAGSLRKNIKDEKAGWVRFP